MGLNFAHPYWTQRFEFQSRGGARGCPSRLANALGGGPCDQGSRASTCRTARGVDGVAVPSQCGSGPSGSGWGLASFPNCRAGVMMATSAVAAQNAEPRSCSMPPAGAAAWTLIVTSSTDANMRTRKRRREPSIDRPSNTKRRSARTSFLRDVPFCQAADRRRVPGHRSDARLLPLCTRTGGSLPA